YLFEELSILKIQIVSAQDQRYPQWTDFLVFDKPNIPEERIISSMLISQNIQDGFIYRFRMLGMDLKGIIHESKAVDYPIACPVKIFLKVYYEDEDCNKLSNIVELSAVKELSSPVSFSDVSYYIKKSDSFEPVARLDLAGYEIKSTTIDTSTLPEGGYPVKAVLRYIDLNGKTDETSATNTLIVDHTLPAGKITYPAKSQMVCPITISAPDGKWLGIPIEGMTEDNTNVKRYELYYGIGENPTVWKPAMTRNSTGESVTIIGYGPVKGQLGLWDVTDLKGTTFSLKLKVIDVVGNVSCYTTSFYIDNGVEIVNLTRDKYLFSPNGDRVLDDLNISYQIDEYATVDVKVFKVLQKPDGSYILDSTPVRTIVSGLNHIAGVETTLWDGKDDANSVVPDGRYGIAVFAKDSCGNARMKWVSTEVDNTPPTTIIIYPRPDEPLGNVVEVRGTAEDPHFQSYTLEAGQGDSPDSWFLVSSNTVPVKDNILGKWNTYGLDGRWTLRLTAYDIADNKNETRVTVDLGTRKNLIKDLDASPRLFSPNNDGKLDTAAIKYELTDACEVKIDMLDPAGVVKKTYIANAPSAGIYTYTWDGRDNGGVIVPDEIYTVKLTATLSSNNSVTQTEAITIIVDTTPPTIDIKQPEENSYHKTSITVNGTISDKNLLEYTLNYTGASGTTILDQGNQNREDYTFGIINEPPEGRYTLNIKAKDLGGNTTEKNITFSIDRTPPVVTLETPKEGEYYGSMKNIIDITGSIVEKNLEVFSLRYGSGDAPAQWIELLSGNTIPATPQLFSWKVGKNDGIPDGLYTLSLFAKDKAGLEGEAKVRIKIDNTPPEVLIRLPHDGDYVKSAVDIKGTAYDQNLDKYTIELSGGPCSTAFKWVTFRTATASVKDGLLTQWQILPPDGDYCLRLTAIDKVGNKAETKVNVKVDTHPPAAPLLSGKVENKSSARLSWTKNTEPDLAGYNLQLSGQEHYR
ncbi:MAG: Ig-like domain-containing protein, partial [Candidatus Aenigmatarchaeota archaeon]